MSSLDMVFYEKNVSQQKKINMAGCRSGSADAFKVYTLNGRYLIFHPM